MVNLFRVGQRMEALRLLSLLLLCGALLSTLSSSAIAAPPSIGDKPKLDAASLELDGPNNILILTEVRITTQSGYTIKAGQARTTDANNFNNSKWTFTDYVQITTPDG